MFLGYTDDSGSGDTRAAFDVMATVLIEDKNIRMVEAVSGTLAELIIPGDRRKQFKEFKASEIYSGAGIFKDIKQAQRFDTITKLLTLVAAKGLVVYGAVRKPELAKGVYGSASPTDICFRICLEGINQTMKRDFTKDIALFIVDDFQDRALKTQLRDSFRSLRKRMACSIIQPNEDPLWNIHDDFYFGSSVDSAGIQMADLCAFFVRKHLEGKDCVAESFFDLFKKNLVYSKLEPDGTGLK